MRILFLFISSLFFILNTNAQNFWTSTHPSQFVVRDNATITDLPTSYAGFTLDFEALKNQLKNAPKESEARFLDQAIKIAIPMPEQDFVEFLVWEAPSMEEEISKKYSNIKSYKGYAIGKKHVNIRFSISPYAFHGSIIDLVREVNIDPYTSRSNTQYIVYDVKNLSSDIYKNIPICGVEEIERPQIQYFRPSSRNNTLIETRKYRTAVACTGEWGRTRGTVEKCIADINAMLTRMNQIYERDLAVSFVLINDNEKLIFLDPATDPYDTPLQGKVMVGQNTGKLNAIIPSNSYDVGHVLSPCTDIGGVATLGSLCQNNKGNGVTCHRNESINAIVVRVMAHEIGHQFSASHTWNRCESAADQRAGNTTFEPGSGSTIMSYAGSCSTDNVVSDNDDYFHVGSLIQMYNKTTQGGNAYACAQKASPGNRAPVVTVPSRSYTIPISTPFELVGSATDEDNDVLTYCWEQYDLGFSNHVLGTSNQDGPLFRSFRPSISGDVRFFPRASNIVSGNFNDKTEVLPTLSRSLKFMLTVKDNNPQGGGVAWKEYNINSTASAGPFRITFPQIDQRFKVGEQVTVTWDVANTDKAPVNCQTVNIYGSFNSALRTDDPNLVPLALGVPNNGSASIFIPNIISNFFRIVIKAADNIFLTSSRLPSRIENATEPGIIFELSNNNLKICQPLTSQVEIVSQGLAGFAGDVDYSVEGLPDGAIATFDKPTAKVGEKVVLSIDTRSITSNFNGSIEIKASSSMAGAVTKPLALTIIATDLDYVELLEPALGLSGASQTPTFVWREKENATKYQLEIATSPSFANPIVSIELDTFSFRSPAILDRSTVHYWRVRSSNECRDGEWSEIFAFSTELLSCSIYKSGERAITIPATGTPTIELEVDIPNEGIISDLNINLIKGDHSRLSDLVAYLVSPNNKECLLWTRACATQQNLNLGLDDEAPNFFACPINNGRISRTQINHQSTPAQKLEIFNGDQMKGIWKLKIEDKIAGSGGILRELNLEICANVSIAAPELIKNNVLKLAPGSRFPIDTDFLESRDGISQANELTYTIVSLPKFGKLSLSGSEVVVGQQFTQDDINNGLLRYSADEIDDPIIDFFTFTVINKGGAWIPITAFFIDINENNPSTTSDNTLANDVFVFPNPTAGLLHVNLLGKATHFDTYIITDISGRKVQNGSLIKAQSTVDIQDLQLGVYFLTLTDGKQSVTKKVVRI